MTEIAMPPGEPMLWRRYGERGLLFDVGETSALHGVAARLRECGIAVECVVGATTLYVEGADTSISVLSERVIQELGAASATTAVQSIRTHMIPCRYDGEDLSIVSDLAQITEDEVINRHCAATYTVAFVGFSRGFPYLVGLDPSLVVSRLDTPRLSVPAGSVAIGAHYSGIYPMASPGGWRLLGRTTEHVFDPTKDPPNRFATGDHVRFVRST